VFEVAHLNLFRDGRMPHSCTARWDSSGSVEMKVIFIVGAQ
jgi:hypothetical protein